MLKKIQVLNQHGTLDHASSIQVLNSVITFYDPYRHKNYHIKTLFFLFLLHQTQVTS